MTKSRTVQSTLSDLRNRLAKLQALAELLRDGGDEPLPGYVRNGIGDILCENLTEIADDQETLSALSV